MALSTSQTTTDVRAWRELITFRRKLIEKRTRAKNGLRALLRTLAIKPPRQPGLWTKQGMLWLKRLGLPQSMYALKRDLLIEEVEALTLRIGRVKQELAVCARNNVSVWQVQNIPGVGLRTAEAIVAFLDDPHRFPNSKCVGAYFGLVPAQDQSGNTNRLGHITRQGSASVRQLLTEAGLAGATTVPYHQRLPGEDSTWRQGSSKDCSHRHRPLSGSSHVVHAQAWHIVERNPCGLSFLKPHPQRPVEAVVPPVIETVMIDTDSSQGISFARPGIVIKEFSPTLPAPVEE